MIDITPPFLRYREMLRVLWNAEFRWHPDGEKEFIAIDSVLFDTIVTSFLNDKQGSHIEGQEARALIAVKQAPGSGLAPLLEGIERNGIVEWKEIATPPAVDLRYFALFDFSTLERQYRDFRFVKAYAIQDPARHFLLDASAVTLSVGRAATQD